MRNSFFLFFLGLIISFFSFSQSTKVLFVGNSYTAYNNLSQLVYDVALSTGDTLIVDSHTPGGQRLLDHAASPAAISKIFSNKWDFVVLQAQSQEPSWPIQQVQLEVFKYATILCDTVRANYPCTRPVFFMTWGRKNGDAMNCPNWPPVCTYEGMDSLLNERYQTMGEDNDALVSPVGAVWHYIRDNHPNIELYSPDESHPSMEGSYAAACTFYSIFLRKDPTLIGFEPGIDPLMAQDIRESVKAIVFDSLLNWNVGEYDPVADFSVVDTTSVSNVSFTNNSLNSDNYLWDFGNGDTSTSENPNYTFSVGTHSVTLISSKCGMSDTLTKTIVILVNGLNEVDDELNVDIFPNPGTDRINIRNNTNLSIESIVLVNVDGKEIIKTGLNSFIDISAIPTGVYIVKISFSNGKETVHRIIKK